MALPGGQNVPTPRESILALSRGSQLPYTDFFAYIPYILYIQTPDIPPWRPLCYPGGLGGILKGS